MDTSVSINGHSYNGAHALKLGKDNWTSDKDVLGHFNGDKGKASEAYDAIDKELSARKKAEDEDKKSGVDAEKERADAQKKLEDREKKPATALKTV